MTVFDISKRQYGMETLIFKIWIDTVLASTESIFTFRYIGSGFYLKK